MGNLDKFYPAISDALAAGRGVILFDNAGAPPPCSRNASRDSARSPSGFECDHGNLLINPGGDGTEMLREPASPANGSVSNQGRVLVSRSMKQSQPVAMGSLRRSDAVLVDQVIDMLLPGARATTTGSGQGLRYEFP